jgi:hypothetical protein
MLRALFVALVVVAGFFPRTANAYPWMLRHDYSVCAVCHTDPSGGNLLTEYGRSLSQTLLSSELLAKRDEDPGKFKDFAFGLVPMPENLQVGGYYRQGYIQNIQSGKTLDERSLYMRADVEAHLQAGKVRVDGSVGVLPSGSSAAYAKQAWVNQPGTTDTAIVARTYWAGYELQDGDALLRAGRLYMPFGLRNIEHSSWVRSETRTDINKDQQHGVSYYFSNGEYRGEVMAVLGNFQMRPDGFRERGLVAYLERRISGRQTLALQGQALRSEQDSITFNGYVAMRHAYGAFYRLVPHEKLALMAEANLLVNAFQKDGSVHTGHVAFVQADFEPFAGVHVMGTLEEKRSALANATQDFGGWLSAAYFPVPHTELRLDLIERKSGDADPVTTVLFQGQLYL